MDNYRLIETNRLRISSTSSVYHTYHGKCTSVGIEFFCSSGFDMKATVNFKEDFSSREDIHVRLKDIFKGEFCIIV